MLGPVHLFRDCQLAKCGCNCVEQLRNTPPNQNLEELTPEAPKFLHIDDELKLRGLDERLLSKFVKMKKDQWLENLDKEDHRTKEFRAKR